MMYIIHPLIRTNQLAFIQHDSNAKPAHGSPRALTTAAPSSILLNLVVALAREFATYEKQKSR